MLKKRYLIGVFFMLFSLASLVVVNAQSYALIPDPNFEQALIDLGIDDKFDGRVSTSNVEGLTFLNLKGKKIRNLEGIGYFKKLEYLDCSDNLLKRVDLEKNTELQTFFADENQLSFIDLTNNSKLQFLRLESNHLTDIYLKYNRELIQVFLSNNSIAEIDLSNNKDLEYLLVDKNKIKRLNLAVNSKLTKVSAKSNPELLYVNIKNSANKNLYTFNLDGSNNLLCVLIDNLDERFDKTEWTIPESVEFNETNCDYTYVPDVNFEKHLIALGYDTYVNKYVRTDRLKEITTLDLSKKHIVELTGIEAFSSLKKLDISNNKVANFPVLSKLKNLESLVAHHNELRTIDLMNFDFEKLEQLDLSNNPYLRCIILFDVQKAYAKAGWKKDDTALFVDECRYVSIKDREFEKVLVNAKIDDVLDGSLLLQAAERVSELNLSNKGIIEIDEIRYFKKLRRLLAPDNQIKSVDLSKNIELEFLDLGANRLYELNLDNNKSLVYANVSNNKLESIDLKNASKLKTLNLSNNVLEEISLMNNILLESIDLSYNSLNSIEIKNGFNTSIKHFDISGNKDLKCVLVDNSDWSYTNEKWFRDRSTLLSSGSCDMVAVKDPNFERALIDQGVDKGVFDGLLLKEDLVRVTDLDVSNKNITSIEEIKYFVNLKKLNVSSNLLTSIDLQNNTSLLDIDVSNNKIKALDFSNNLQLKKIKASNNLLSKFLLTGLSVLEYLNVSNNDLRTIDLQESPVIKDLLIAKNKLNAIDISLLPLLERLELSNNGIERIDLSSNEALVSLNLKSNKLSSLNLISNQLIKTLDLRDNVALLCIAVENISRYINASGFFKDKQSVYVNKKCEYINIEDVQFEQALIEKGYDSGMPDGRVPKYNVMDIIDLNLSSKGIASLKGIEHFLHLKTIDVSKNDLLSVDFSANLELQTINISGNALKFVNFDKNLNIKILNVSNNILETITLDKASQVESLDVSNNRLSELDLRGLASLTKLKAFSNTSLSCIYIDEVVKPREFWQKDTSSFFTKDCKFTAIADENFEKELIALGIDQTGLLDGRVPKAWLLEIKEMNLRAKAIRSLEGIQDFKNLEKLDVSDNYLTKLKLEQNPKIKTLILVDNTIQELELSSLGLLEKLDASYNLMTKLDVSNNSNLKELLLADNNLKAMDLITNLQLQVLDISQNEIESIALDNNILLKSLILSDNVLKEINLEHLTLLESLDVSANDFSDLNLKGLNSIKDLDVTGNKYLGCIYVDDLNQSRESWHKDKQSFFTLDCKYTSIPDLRFEQMLIHLNIDKTGVIDQKIPTMWIEDVTNLNLYKKGIKSLEGIQDFKNLKSLNLADNGLTEIDLTQNGDLEDLILEGNKLSNLNLSYNQILKRLDASNNKLGAIDLSNNPLLETVNLYSNALTSLDLRKVENLTNLDVRKNLDLYCIIVDDPYQERSQWKKETKTVFTVDCKYTEIADVRFEKALIKSGIDQMPKVDYRVPTSWVSEVKRLDVSSKGITSLSGIEDFKALEELDASNNKVNQLDLSKNTKLRRLDLSKNNLDEVNLSGLSNLERLDVSDNDLSSKIDVKAADKLIFLNAINNKKLLAVETNQNLDITEKWVTDDGVFLRETVKLVDIPDSNFEKALITLGIDKSKKLDGKVLEEFLLGVEELDVTGKGIESIEGIEYFENLKVLKASDNNLVLADFTYNVALQELDLSNNAITKVVLDKNKVLEKINISENMLSNLNLGNNLELKYLNCSDNELEEIDLSKNYNLVSLMAKENLIRILNVRNNRFLKLIEVSKNNIFSVDFTFNEQLERVDVSNNNISEILVKNTQTSVKYLNYSHNKLTDIDLRGYNIPTLDITNNSTLRCVLVDDVIAAKENWIYDDYVTLSNTNCNFTNITDSNFEQALIDLGYDTGKVNGYIFSDNIALVERLDIPSKGIKSLAGIEAFTSLKTLNCSDNEIKTLDMSGNLDLVTLNCANNKISKLDISSNSELLHLYCQSNELTAVDLFANKKLVYLYCFNNKISFLNLSPNIELIYLYAYNNLLRELDLSKNTELQRILIQSNNLKSLNLKNKFNTSISILNISNNPDLVCVMVNDPNFANDKIGWVKDTTTLFSSDPCRFTVIPDRNFEQALIDLSIDNGVLDGLVLTNDLIDLKELDVSNQYIESLSGIQAFVSLEKLDCSKNNIKELDIYSNKDLIFLDISFNQLKGINLYGNKNLQTLRINRNNLKQLELPRDNNINYLDASFNQLSSIDLGTSLYLKHLDLQYNNLISVNLIKNTRLGVLNLSHNNFFGSISLVENVLLREVYLNDNNLSVINIRNSNNTLIEKFNATNNKNLRCILVDEVLENTKGWLKQDVANYSITNCNFIKIPDVNFERSLVSLNIDDEVDGRLLVSNAKQVISLGVSDSDIEDLYGIQVFTNLKYLNLSDNNLTDLNLTNNLDLAIVNVSNNLLKNISLPLDNEITELYCPFNRLTALDVSGSKFLKILLCSSNLIKGIDLSDNSRLTKLDAEFNELEKLNLRNGNNDILTTVNITNNINLQCVLVDRLENPILLQWAKDEITVFNTDSCRITHIPDPNFEQALIDLGIDFGIVDGKVSTNSVYSVTSLDVRLRNISDMTGVEDFINLNVLKANGNIIKEIDISALKALKILDLSNNDLEEVKLEENKTLESLSVKNNRLKSIDVSNNTKLRNLVLNNNKLTDLSLKQNVFLSILKVADNEIKRLNLGTNRNLNLLSAENNKLIDIDLKNGNNVALVTLNLTNNPDLYCVRVDKEYTLSNRVKGWRKDNTAQYTNQKCYIQIPDDKLEMALSKYDNILGDNQIPTLVISTLRRLDIQNAGIKTLEGIQYMLALEYIDASDNEIDEVELKNLTKLKQLKLNNNKIESLDLLFNKQLESFEVKNNRLEVLKVGEKPKLNYVNCSENQIINLDFSAAPLLNTLNAENNRLLTLNLQNGELNSIPNLNTSNNPDLRCLQVNDISVAERQRRWIKDVQTAFNVDNCNLTYIPNKNFEEFIVSNNYDHLIDGVVITDRINVIESLDLSNRFFDDVRGIEGFQGLRKLNLSGNLIEEIDLSKNIRLTDIDVSNNKLKKFDLRNTRNLSIVRMNASGNELPCIQVDKRRGLRYKSGWIRDSNTVYAEGRCNFIPIVDGNFEQALIDLDYDDGTVNGTVILDNIVDIEYLDLPGRNIRDITGIEYFNNLRGLNVSDNALASLDVSRLSKLERLNASGNMLSAINLLSNTRLEMLQLSDNKIRTINTRNIPKLEILYVINNYLEQLDLSNNLSLSYLYCANNQLENLNLSFNESLIRVIANNNNFNTVDLRNHHNGSLSTLNLTNNPLLTCIEVDDPDVVLEFKGWEKDARTKYTTDCDFIY